MARPFAGIARHPYLTAVGVVVAALVLVVVFFDWNWLRPFAERTASSGLGRPVTIQNLSVRDFFSREPTLVADGIVVGNPPGFPDGSHLGTVDELTARIDLHAIIASFGSNLVVEEVALDHPQGDLRPGPDGKPNWAFDFNNAPNEDSHPPRIGSVVIKDGSFHIIDPTLKADVVIKTHTTAPTDGSEAKLVATATGTYGGVAMTASFTGGSLLSLGDSAKPYPLDLQASAGKTKIHLKGTLQDPQKLTGADLQLELSGEDLADLYPLLHIPLAPTPLYNLRGHLEYSGDHHHIKFSNFVGQVGDSDLEGFLDVDRGYERPLITADIKSKNVALADLGGFIGAAPGKADSANLGQKQKQEHKKQEQESTLLPNTEIDLAKIRSTDFRVHYKGAHIVSDWVPVDDLDTNLSIDNGRITLDPLNFTVGKGKIKTKIELDGRVNPIKADADIEFQNVDLGRVMQATKTFHGFGNIGGRAIIDGRGNSLAKILGDGNGDLKLYMADGELSAILVNLAGLDFGSTLASAIGLPEQAKIRCLLSDFQMRTGVLYTCALVLDTDQANIVGTGTINLRKEWIDYQINQEPKHPSIGALHAPIDVTGPLKSPSVKPDLVAVGARLGVAAALGVIFPPAALLPTIQLGTGEDNNCHDLLQNAYAATQGEQHIPDHAVPATQQKPTKRRG